LIITVGAARVRGILRAGWFLRGRGRAGQRRTSDSGLARRASPV